MLERLNQTLDRQTRSKVKKKRGRGAAAADEANHQSDSEQQEKRESLEHANGKAPRRYKRKKEKYENIFKLLDNCGVGLKANPNTKNLIRNPFKVN